MEKWIYYRCSTASQGYDSQKTIIKEYFNHNGFMYNIDKMPKIEDFAHKRDKKMKLKNIWLKIKNVPDGSTIYCSELSRLGCNMTEILNFINYCSERNITVIQCKDGSKIENNTIAGKALIFALT